MGRNLFASVLSDQLGVRVDLRGVKLREDVVALARTALNEPDGKLVLIDVVGICQGSQEADELRRLLFSEAEIAFTALLPGPLAQADLRSALSLLDGVKGHLSGVRLRDGLATELCHDLPLGLSLRQLFSYAVELNVQPDGLPPAVLLIDQAAELTGSPYYQGHLASWAHTWAERSGLLTALERRRADRADAAPDPAIPRCLVVAVEPARDGSGDIVVRPWLNTAPGHWRPQPADPETTSLDGLDRAVERALRQLLRLPSAQYEPPPDGNEPSLPYVEFVLPYDLLNHDVADLHVRSGDGERMPLGVKYGVHLRSLERMRTDDILVRAQWQDRWNTLHERGIAVHGWRRADSGGLGAWQAALAAEPSRTAAVLDAPDGGAATQALKAAIAEGVGLAVWDRRGVFPEERREVVTAVFAAVQRPDRLPVVIHQLRRDAVFPAGNPLLLGRHIAFFWDDPNRLVDIQTVADHALKRDTDRVYPHTIDSEETPV